MSFATKLCSNAKPFYHKKNHDFEKKRVTLTIFIYISHLMANGISRTKIKD